MCFSGQMAGLFASSSLIMAALLFKAGHPPQQPLAVLYFGAMETLQAVQYLFVAVPEDQYKMCGSSTNQFLTILGLWHIAFQPYICNMLLFSLVRENSLKHRYANDIILRISFVAGVSLCCRYSLAIFWPDNPHLAPRGTESCPNYEWCAQGFDGYLKKDTPNLPGHSCTFLPETPTGHLAWAFPFYQHSYTSPCVSLHALLMFGPSLLFPKLSWMSMLNILSGPYLAASATVSINEQAAIWCYNSMYQCLVLTVISFCMGPGQEFDERIEHPGGFGEKPLKYSLIKKAGGGYTNGHGTNNDDHDDLFEDAEVATLLESGERKVS